MAGMWKETGVEASDRTAHRRLHEQGFRCRISAIEALLNAKQRQKWLKWCRKKKDWTAEQWSSVMFSDEPKFAISFGNKGPRVRRKTVNVTWTAASSKMWSFHNLLWFGAPCHQLVLVTSASSNLPLVQQFTKISRNISCKTVQLPKNSAKSTQGWFKNSQLQLLDWSANSPDLNLIENLWAIVKKKLNKNHSNTSQQLKDAMKTRCIVVTPYECQQLIHSMPRRIDVVTKVRRDGQSIDTLECNLGFIFFRIE